MSRRLVFAVVCSCVAAGGFVALSGAAAGGPPPGIVSDGNGITSPDGSLRYFALAGGTQTLLEAIRIQDGTLVNEAWLPGRYGIPAISSTPTGLTADGKTLVLTTYPQALGSASFAVVGVPAFDVTRVVSLRGNWAYDAVAPNGRTLYLIQYLASHGTERYLVRAYDLRLGRLVKRVIAAREEKGPMTGSPIARATTRDGSWAYTLYSRASGQPFVHALDTVHRLAVCVDLPWKHADGWIGNARLRLSRDGTKIYLRQLGANGRRGVIDTHTWKVTVSTA
jgi:hypothetical protein